MKCLSVKNPWAALINAGIKTIELRTWPTNYRGPLLIVSTTRVSMEGPAIRWCVWSVGNPYTVCLVDLVDCRPATFADTEAACCRPANHFAWVLNNVRQLPGAPGQKGQLSLYEPAKPLASFVAKTQRHR